MNPAIKDEWIKALLSGNYTQGSGRLKMRNYETGKDHFCCLGVLTDLAIKSGIDIEVEREDNEYNEDYFFDGDHEFLPKVVMEWAELKHDNGWFKNGPVDGVDESLAELNDKGRSFSELADIIMKYF